jgi:hypothetical protein
VQRFQGDASAGTAVGVDAAQNVYLAGIFTGTNYIGAHKLDSAGGDNLFLAKFDSFGAVQWVITAAGSLNKMLVSSNGAVFICGNLTLHPPAAPTLTSNIMLARLDEGVLAWAHFRETDISRLNVCFGPDESLFVLAATNRNFVRNYSANGEILNSFNVERDGFEIRPLAIAVDPGNQVYVASRARVRPNDAATVDEIQCLSPTGEELWVRKMFESASHYNHWINGLIASKDGGVLYIGNDTTPLPQTKGFVKKLSSTGDALWQVYDTGYFKMFFYPFAMALDQEGNVFVTGAGNGTYYNEEQLWILSISPEGSRRSEHYVRSYRKRDYNAGHSIAVGRDGAMYITGVTFGAAQFGTNTLWPAVDSAHCVFARQSSVQSRLDVITNGSEIILTWPSAAFPLALQQSDAAGTNWFFVTNAPEFNDWRYTVVLPIPSESVQFRLTATNPPAISRVRWFDQVYGPTATYFDHKRVVIAGTTKPTQFSLGAYGEYSDERNRPFVFWVDADKGANLTNQINIAWKYGKDDWNERYDPWFDTSVNGDTDSFPPGFHSAFSVLSNGGTLLTNRAYTFEVLSFSTALSELGAALEPYATNSWGRLTMKLFGRVEEAVERNKPLLAAERLRRFQKHLQFNKLLSEDDRARCVSAAGQLEAVLRAE